jgi:hypothetical protein
MSIEVALAFIALDRAMRDVELVAGYLEVARRELGLRQVQEAATALLKDPSLPAGPGCFSSGRDSREAGGLFLLRQK